MNTAALNRDLVLPSAEDAVIAQEASHHLAPFIDDDALEIEIIEDDKRQSLILPASAVRLLLDLLTQMGKGNAVTLIPYHAELTTQQCADMLNVSRKHFIDEILDKEELPFRKVGTHRRVLFEDLMTYKRKCDAERRGALDQMTAISQELGME